MEPTIFFETMARDGGIHRGRTPALSANPDRTVRSFPDTGQIHRGAKRWRAPQVHLQFVFGETQP